MTRKPTIEALTALAATCLILVPLALSAQPRGGDFGPGRGGRHHPGMGLMHELMADRLDLSAAQREQMLGLHETHRATGETLHQELWERRSALRETTIAEIFDEQAVRQAATAVAEIEVEIAVHHARVRQEMRMVLTAEQRSQLDTMRERMGKRREHWQGHGHDRWHHGGE